MICVTNCATYELGVRVAAALNSCLASLFKSQGLCNPAGLLRCLWAGMLVNLGDGNGSVAFVWLEVHIIALFECLCTAFDAERQSACHP